MDRSAPPAVSDPAYGVDGLIAWRKSQFVVVIVFASWPRIAQGSLFRILPKSLSEI
jgi:hypothetical protein